MKPKYLLFILVLGILGCGDKNKDNVGYIPPELIGKWKVIELCTTDGESVPAWSPYDSGETYDSWYKRDGTHISYSSTNPDCEVSRYKVTGKYIYFSGTPCSPDKPVIIEQLTDSLLIINLNHFETFKSKSVKVFD
ncbi:MAG: hypothetical protein JXR65_09070 [Bacteroidales bacterium]|nr:hypothetical protein [Bacteroidales bacterium]